MKKEKDKQQSLVGKSKNAVSTAIDENSKCNYYHKLLISLPDLFFTLNPNGVITDYYTRDKNALFVPPETFLNKHFDTFLPSDTQERIQAAFAQAIQSGKVTTVIYKLPYTENPEHFEGRFAPLKEGDGAVFVVRNITKQISTEEKLVSLSILHQLIVEFSSMLVQSSLENIDLNINLTLEKLGHYSNVDRVYIFEYLPEEDVVNNTYEWCSEGISPEISNLQGIPFEAVPRWKEKFRQKEHVYIPLISEIDDQYVVEKEILEPQGILSLLALPMFYGDKFVGFIGFDAVKNTREWSNEHIALLRLAGEIIAGTIARNKFENEIIQSRKAAEQANKTKSEFLASMSHEIRTPMNAILGFSEILFNNLPDEKSRSYLSGILSSGKTLLHLINDILDLSKIEAGQMEIFLEPTIIEGIFTEIGKIFSTKLIEKQLDFEIKIADDFPKVIMIDDVRLRQILFNLVGNAVKFTYSGSITLEVKFKPAANDDKHIDILINVSDTGIGIPKSHQESIFDSFVQVETDNARQHGGTGLGLAITSKLVRMMNGEISVVSEPGKGSTFTVAFNNLEVTDTQPDRKNMFEWIDKEISFDPATILVIDDVAFNRELVKSFLINFELNVLEASSGLEGVKMATLYKPDLILMDLRMPGMTGYQATNALKEQPETANIPCIAFTASTLKHDEAAIRELFDDYLLKPLTRNDIIDSLLKFLPHSKIDQKKDPVNDNQEPTMSDQLLKNPQILNIVKKIISEEVLPALENLYIYMDAEITEKLVNTLKSLGSEHNLDIFNHSIKHLKLAVDNFDFILFKNELNRLKIQINLIMHQ